jgi:acyl dehydratase
MAGRYYEELEVGAIIAHDIHRTVTETDNLLITALTHNPAALHLDAEYCRQTEFGKPLVNSCFTLALMVGISINDTTHRTAIANLGWDEVRFPKPVFVGDTLRIETEVHSKRASQSRPDAGIVTFVHRAFNQRGEEVANCRRNALMMRRPAVDPA